MTTELPATRLCLEGLTLHAGGRSEGRVLCQALDLRAGPGERWVLLGPNGAGKSTLLSAIAGLIPPSAGRIVLGGRELADWSTGELARRRAWCPQFWHDPFPFAAWEIVASGLLATQPGSAPDFVEAQARHWLRQFHTDGFADHDVRHLSGGERQRVALATVFAQGAPLLLLDEPSAHLDWAHQGGLRRNLLAWTQRRGTVLMAVHDLNLAWSLCTHAVLLDGKGRVRTGLRDKVLTAEALSSAYGVPVTVLETKTARWFRVEWEHARA